ncbi:hypothetical protein AMTRI_Chr13g118680 [Amborella trichopoda]
MGRRERVSAEMTKDEDFKLLKIQTCVLKVHIHCEGCKQEVKKVLQKIEGVYTVSIDAEQQKVTVSGNVDYATLMKKLSRSGKHAEPWLQKAKQSQQKVQTLNPNKQEKSNNNQNQRPSSLIKDMKAFKKLQAFNLEEDDFSGEDDEDSGDEDEACNEFRMMVQNNGKKNPNPNPNHNQSFKNGGAGTPGSGGKNANSSERNSHNQSAMKVSDQKGPNNSNGSKVVGFNGAEVKRGGHEINGIGGLGLGFNGAGANGAGLGFQPQQHHFNNLQGAAMAAQGYGVNPTSYQQQLQQQQLQQQQQQQAAVMMMMNNNSIHRPQTLGERYMPQMMYYRAPPTPAATAFHHPQSESAEYATHIFSDENANSCSIM